MAVRNGERRRPDPLGWPGYLRVDTAHRDRNDAYDINLVDPIAGGRRSRSSSTLAPWPASPSRSWFPLLEEMLAAAGRRPRLPREQQVAQRPWAARVDGALGRRPIVRRDAPDLVQRHRRVGAEAQLEAPAVDPDHLRPRPGTPPLHRDASHGIVTKNPLVIVEMSAGMRT